MGSDLGSEGRGGAFRFFLCLCEWMSRLASDCLGLGVLVDGVREAFDCL